MRVLVTGHNGYIGTVLAPQLQAAGHDVVGLDSFLFEGCTLGAEAAAAPSVRMDVRDVGVDDLRGFDAVLHLAAVSNDPVGHLDPGTTYEINHEASVRLAQLAKEAGVERFVFSSSCSLYGSSSTDGLLDEGAAFDPVTPYGHSKVLAEQDISPLADDDFSPTFLRNATVYGASPALRADVVVNNLTGLAFLTGEIRMQSDGTPWRPLVHVQDISAAFLAVLEAPRDAVHGQAFNVGRTEENFRVREVAAMVEELVPGSRVRYAEGAGPDPRCYRVACDKLPRHVPAFRPTWTVRRGIEELAEAYRRCALRAEDFEGEPYVRLKRVRGLVARGRLDEDLRWS
jgi:nucleoside-diphosphate-sugar epimerase